MVNQSDVTDPATGKFGQTVPVDSIESVNVLNTPFLAQYGRFTQSVVAVETRRGGDKWHYDLNDPFPDFFVHSCHMLGIRNETPRAVAGGPLIKDRLFVISALQYFLDKNPNRTLPFPFNISKHERVNSFTQIDYILSQRQIVNATFHFNPEHTNFVNPDYFNPEPVTPSYAQQAYEATLAHHLGLWGGTLDTSVAYQRFHTFIGAQGPGGEIVTPEGNSGNYFGTQTRDAFRREWLEIWSPAPVRFYGCASDQDGHVADGIERPRRIQSTGRWTYSELVRAIAGEHRFRQPGAVQANGSGVYGIRAGSLDSQFEVFDRCRAARGASAAGVESADRAAGGYRLDSVLQTSEPFFARATGSFTTIFRSMFTPSAAIPNRTITMYAPDGSVIGAPEQYRQRDRKHHRAQFVSGARAARRGSLFAARRDMEYPGGTQLFETAARAGRLHGQPVGGADRACIRRCWVPRMRSCSTAAAVPRYRQAEITAKMSWKSGQQLVFSYVRSRAEGDQNVFDNFVGNFAEPFIRPSVYANLPGDLPNRFLMWGHVKIPFQRFELIPTVEYRNGFPYTAFDVLQNYVGVPNSDASGFRISFPPMRG